MRLARAFDGGERDFARIATAVGKYWVCRRGPGLVFEALECHGGNGYVEESVMPRLYREAPLSSIWEGSGNVMCLDVLRAMRREPLALQALLGELEKARGAEVRFDRFLEALKDELARPDERDARARSLVGALGRALQAALLLQHAPQAVAEAFCASRLEGAGHHYGALPGSLDLAPLLERAWPSR